MSNLQQERDELQRLNENWHARNVKLVAALKGLLELVDDLAEEGFIVIKDDNGEDINVAAARAALKNEGKTNG